MAWVWPLPLQLQVSVRGETESINIITMQLTACMLSVTVSSVLTSFNLRDLLLGCRERADRMITLISNKTGCYWPLVGVWTNGFIIYFLNVSTDFLNKKQVSLITPYRWITSCSCLWSRRQKTGLDKMSASQKVLVSYVTIKWAFPCRILGMAAQLHQRWLVLQTVHVKTPVLIKSYERGTH